MTVANTLCRPPVSLLGVLLVLVAALAGAPSAHGMEALRPSLKELSEKIAKFLEGSNETEILVGAFTGPARSPSSSGPGIKFMLIEELRKQKVKGQPIKVTRNAKLEVKGDYRAIVDKHSKLLTLRLYAEVLDGQGERVVELEKKIEDRDVLALLLGITRPDFGAGLTPKKESEALQEHMLKPKTELRDTRIKSEAKSGYAIEILVKSGAKYVPVKPAKDEAGLTHVDLKPGQVFAVRLINETAFDAAVELRLDGLSMFAFSKNTNYRHVIIPKKDSALIKGWHRSNEVSDEFAIGEYAKTAVKELLANPDNMGTITVTFAAAWDPNGEKPTDEGAKFRDPFGAIRGNPVKTPYKEVLRESGRIRDIIAVRYNK